MATQTKKQVVFTPVGKAKFPWLHTPNTKFNSAGTYDLKILLEEDAEETQALIKILDDAHAVNLAAVKTELEEKGAKGKVALKKLTEQLPYEADYDKEGNETGFISIKAKLDAEFKNKKGETIKQAPTLVDALGKPLKKGTAIYGGSTVRAKVGINPYYVGATGAVGISLRLWAVQVIELVTAGGGSNAGFDAVVGGYSAADDDNDYSAATNTSDEDTDNDQEEDF